jgi:hypothetical protein
MNPNLEIWYFKMHEALVRCASSRLHSNSKYIIDIIDMGIQASLFFFGMVDPPNSQQYPFSIVQLHRRR